ncbi:RNA polymerase sigma factor [Carboxylicivirga sp. RSCT41]|uniref:RNA polymerase sigma factor n=1 Tax=Carboxylicivirga agarovorans TaxID=3417570 RepID=UPI003D34E02F
MKLSGKNVEYNSQAFKKVFDRLYPSMHMVATRIMNCEEKGKDIAQDAFIKLWQNRNQEFDSEEALRAYLYVLIKNACFSQIRRDKRLSIISIEKGILVVEKEIKDEILREETYRLLHKAINDLSPQGMKVIQMVMRGYTNQEIAEEMGVTINTVKTVRQRAYKTLRESLDGQLFIILMVAMMKIL